VIVARSHSSAPVTLVIPAPRRLTTFTPEPPAWDETVTGKVSAREKQPASPAYQLLRRSHQGATAYGLKYAVLSGIPAETTTLNRVGKHPGRDVDRIVRILNSFSAETTVDYRTPNSGWLSR